jgi:hypothetical protein
MTADVSCRLLEVDFSGIESVLVGYFLHRHQIDEVSAAAYVRLSRLGLHAAVAAIKLGKPADLTWPDDELQEYLREIKHADAVVYDTCKRTVHGCLTGEHEVLTPTGWVRLDAYQEGTSAAQWEDGRLTFVVPSAVTRVACQSPELISLFGRSLSQVLTPDHRLPYRAGRTCRWRVVTAATLPPHHGEIPSGGLLEGSETVDSDFLRLVVAAQADASLLNGMVVFHFVKPRKIARLHEILGRLGLEYTQVPCSCHEAGVVIRLPTPIGMQIMAWLEGPRKTFHLPAFLRLTAECRSIVLEELLHWDGSRGDQSGRQSVYFTTNRQQAEVVQTLAATVGRQALLRIQVRGRTTTRQDCYRVSFNRRQRVAVESLTREAVPAPEQVYCLTVPSSFFLVRHRDRISVTGNTNYGVTPYGLAERFPDLFPSIKSAEETQQFLFALAPGLPKWHLAVRQRAKATGYLGGLSPEGVPPSIWDHPFGYRHNFWDVLAYRPADEVTARRWLKDPKMAGRIVYLHGRPFKVVWGGDSKRAIAYYPQSTGSGGLKRAELRLFHPYASDLLGEDVERDYIGDAYFGRTPLLHPIHDALLLHVPNRVFDRVAETVIRVMQDGIPELPCPLAWGLGPTLRIGVEASAGRTWEKSSMTKIDVPPIVTGVVSKVDRPVLAPIENEEEEWDALRRSVA